MIGTKHQTFKAVETAAVTFRTAYHLYRLALRDAKKSRSRKRVDPLAPDGELYLSFDPKIWKAIIKARYDWHVSSLHPDPLIGRAKRRLIHRIRDRELLEKQRIINELVSRPPLSREELEQYIKDRIEKSVLK